MIPGLSEFLGAKAGREVRRGEPPIGAAVPRANRITGSVELHAPAVFGLARTVIGVGKASSHVRQYRTMCAGRSGMRAQRGPGPRALFRSLARRPRDGTPLALGFLRETAHEVAGPLMPHNGAVTRRRPLPSKDLALVGEAEDTWNV